MAKPQKENGYTPIAHEILDEICFRKFNATQLRIIMKVWRLTYGYNRKDHDFSNSFLQMTTGISEASIKREVTALIKSKVLKVTKQATSTEARKVSFNKDYEQWDIPKSGDYQMEEYDLFGVSEMIPQDESRGIRNDPSEVSDLIPQSGVLSDQIRSPYKEIKILKKSIKEKESMFENFWSVYPRRVSRQQALITWNKHCKDPNFDPDLVIANTVNFTETHKLIQTKPNFILHASTYLNQKRYEDYPTVDPEGIAASNNKFDSNLDFLKNQLGGGGPEQGTSYPALGEGNRGLPE
ncbi:replication protein [Paenibacillus sp. JDR-2]|uniref:replication protein n=1 Tax=Paenibacillus sp. (strain JDR-2) TaxID=324057 RepID=UPI000166A684|nr:replication protein [Paenibacillus sp. JDR-2]ACT00261.1 hypothetical protein Pjdr2_1591 [Paenibacillus sp. JDR-2]